MAKALTAIGLFGVAILAAASPWLAPGAAAGTGINQTINFQGKLVNTDGTNIPDGTYNMEFKLYTGGNGCVGGGSSPCSGSNVWTEDWLNNNSQGVSVSAGIFQVNLGSITSLPTSVFNNDTVWMSINLGNTNLTCTPFGSCSGDGEMLPFIRFTASPYSFNSLELGGIGANGFAQLSPASAQSGSLNVTGSVQAATSLQAPLVDTATATALDIGTGMASSVTIGQTTTPFLIQGNSTSTFTATNSTNTTTVGFATPTANQTLTFAAESGAQTICTTAAATCNTTYEPYSSTGYLAKNATDTSTVTGTAVTAGNYLYGFTNNSTATTGGVLNLSNGANTGNALYVTASGNPAASTNALVVVNNTAGSPSGNLIDLQKAGANELSVDYNGNVTQNGGTSTTDTVNGQTISAAANFTGTVTATGTIIGGGTFKSADQTAGNTAAVTLTSGNASVGSSLNSGSVTIDSGTPTSGGTAGSISVAPTNSGSVTIGRNGSGAPTIAIEGGSSSSFQINNGTDYSLVQFTAPTAQVTYTLGTNASNTTATICTSLAASCSSTYEAAGSYLLQNPAANDASTSNFAGYQYSFTQSNTGAAGNLSLTNAGTGDALSVSASTNPGATTSALIVANNTNGTPSGNLLDLQKAGANELSVDTSGDIATLGGYTQTGSTANTLTGATTISAGSSSVNGLTVNNNSNFGTNSGTTLTVGINSTPNAKLNVNTGSAVAFRAYEASTYDIGQFAETGAGVGNVNTNATTTVSGGSVSPLFTQYFRVGDAILVNGQLRTVSSIASDTSMVVSTSITSGTNQSYYNGVVGPGTVTTNGTTAIVGSSTTFTTTFQAGDTILINGETNPGTVASITDNTHLTLVNTAATSASGLAYARSEYDRLDIKANGNVGIGTNSSTAALMIQPDGVGQAGFAIQGADGQTALLQQNQDYTGAVLSSFGTNGQLTLGRAAGSGTQQTGTISFVDGTSGTNTYVDTLNVASLSGNHTISLPDAAGTICLTSQNCSTAGSGYILSQSSSPGTAQTGANFNIAGTGIAGTALESPILDTATGVALTIGNTHATAINLGNTTSNIATTINGTASVQPTSGHDSGTAFTVKNGAGTTTELQVDTSGNQVVVDGTTGSATLTVQNTSSNTNVLNVQDSSSTSLIEATNSDNVNLGKAPTAPFGNANTGSAGGSDDGDLLAIGFTTGVSGGGAISSISAYVSGAVAASPDNKGQIAIYSDSSGSPGSLLASSSPIALTASAWNTFSISYTLMNSTPYWFTYWENSGAGENRIGLETPTVGTTLDIAHSAYGSLPGTWPGTATGPLGNYDMSIYATYAASSEPAVELNNSTNQADFGYGTGVYLQGAGAYFSNPQGNTDAEAFGLDASVSGSEATALGEGSTANYQGTAAGQGSFAGQGSLALGQNTGASGLDATSVGGGAAAVGNYGVSLGAGASAPSNASIALGVGALTTAVNQLVVGGSNADGTYIQNAYFGSGSHGRYASERDLKCDRWFGFEHWRCELDPGWRYRYRDR